MTGEGEKMNTQEKSLVEGNVKVVMLKFALPIFLGSLFQQLYNMADALIVGNFAGDLALAAISSTSTIVFLFMGFFIGMYQGMAVLIARFFGAEDHVNVRKSVCTAVVFGICSGVFLTVCGVLFSQMVVNMVGTPDEVYQDSVIYLRFYFAGAVFTAIYNTMCGICRSLGDSRRPLYYLAIASVINVILDLIFVASWGMGVKGAAIATVIAQAISALLSYYRLRRLEEYSFAIRNVPEDFDANLLKQMVRIGIPTGVQNSVIALANVVVQSSINSFGSIVMAGTGAYTKLQGIIFLPIEAFGMASTTFVSQNLGARQFKRVKAGARFGVTVACVSAEVMGIIAFIFAPSIIGIFGGGVEAVAVGALKLRVDALFFFFLAYAHSVSGVMRGAGRAKTPMLIMLGVWCVIRVLYIKGVMFFTDDVIFVFWAYPITWVLSGGMFFTAYRNLKKSLDKEILI